MILDDPSDITIKVGSFSFLHESSRVNFQIWCYKTLRIILFNFFSFFTRSYLHHKTQISQPRAFLYFLHLSSTWKDGLSTAKPNKQDYIYLWHLGSAHVSGCLVSFLHCRLEGLQSMHLTTQGRCRLSPHVAWWRSKDCHAFCTGPHWSPAACIWATWLRDP